ncbi:MAG: 4Fe-4S dicluster domain-containing protein [Deltaproteobacteria bacterium]|nr:4Fe-4S dicluster domain-containing protein [Deltaproteobacteria bacterium]
MFFYISLYIALAVFVVGLVYKFSTWFRYDIGIEAGRVSTSARVSGAIKGIVWTLFSVKILTLVKVFVFDVILQLKILRQDFLRWLMHICIYVGFMLLLLMHALDSFVSSALFTEYYSSINPFLFLRDLFGAMVILGIAIAVCRRFILKVPRLATNAMDHYAIIIMAVIMISGIFLEGTKIMSYTAFTDMVDEYGDLDGEDEMLALESYWVSDFGVVSPNVKAPFDQEVLAQGQETHEMSCVECHSRPQWAFTGYAVVKIFSPIALALDRANVPTLLWYIHFLACWLGLAYLPFSKMFHIFAGPLSLLTNSVMEKGKSDPANIATRQVMELDACTHCCTCTLNCSAGTFYDHFSNINILPSEKIISIKALAAGKELSEQALKEIQEGVYLCTNCKRCTVVCPVGINLQDLWFNVRESLLGRGFPELLTLSPFSFYRGFIKENGDSEKYLMPLNRAREAVVARGDLMKKPDGVLSIANSDKGFKGSLNLSDQANTFSVCFGCETCTSVCPVVANYDNPGEILDLLPHQIMHSCALGMKDLAIGSNMLWDCLTCYQCQEQCPQGVCITDVFYELKNEAVRVAQEQTREQIGKSI